MVRFAPLLLALAACSRAAVPVDDLSGADDGDAPGEISDAGASDAGGAAESDAGTTGTAPLFLAGDDLRATTDVNLRTGPGTSNAVILVIPVTAVSKALEDEQGGWVKVSYASHEGYTSAKFEEKVASGSDAGSSFVARAKLSVGFSYWWGHGAWSTTAGAAPGSCSGSCPSCTHAGSFGADCSGMVAKAWMVPSSNWSFSADSHPYSTYNFYNETTHWKPVDRAEAKGGDAMVYRQDGAGHVFLYEGGDPWGSLLAIECKGCVAGCVRGYRTASTAYKAIRRDP